MNKLKITVLISFFLFLFPTVLAADVKVTFQGDNLYTEGEQVAIDVFIESDRADGSSFPLSTFELFIEQVTPSMFQFTAPTPTDSQNLLTGELNFNGQLSPTAPTVWSMQDTADDPVTLTATPVRIGTIRGNALQEGMFQLFLSSARPPEFLTGLWPMSVSYTYNSIPIQISILAPGHQCLMDSHCPLGQICNSYNQCQITGEFSISIPVDAATELISSQYVCSPADNPTSYGISPPITISNSPRGTNGYVLIVDDLNYINPSTSQPAVHWVMVTRSTGSTIIENWQPPNPRGGSFGLHGMNEITPNSGYAGPCPSIGDEAHQYRFRLYAVSDTSGFDRLSTRSTKAEVLNAINVSDTHLEGAAGRVIDVAVAEVPFRFSCTISDQCGAGLTCNSGTGLCVAPAGPQCNDGVNEVCTMGSTQPCTTANGYSGTQTCASDCTAWGECTTMESCGDGTANGLETCSTCSQDAGDCSPEDGDSDGVVNPADQCLSTPAGRSVYPEGSANAGCQLGDINKNGCIDLPDWNIFLGLIGAYFEDTAYTGTGDLTNANGLDLGDWNMFLGAMGQYFTTC